jgi:hypothetical protein
MPPKRIKTPAPVATDGNPAKKQKLDSDLSSSTSMIVDVVSKADDRQVCWYDGNCKQKNSVHWATYRHEKQTAPIIPPDSLQSTTTTTTNKATPPMSPVKPTTTKAAQPKHTIAYAASSSSSEDEYVPLKKAKPVKSLSKPVVTKAPVKTPMTSKKVISPSSSDDDEEDMKPAAKGKATAANTNGKALNKRTSLSNLLGSDDPSHTTKEREGLVNYKNMMRYMLTGFEIGPEKKKLLLEVRKKEVITKEEHEALLGTFGWTADEYEVGEREPDHDYDLKEELQIYKQDSGFKIVVLTQGQKLTKEQEAVWSKASVKFFQTMAKAQGNYTIKSLGIIMNTNLHKSFQAQKKKYEERDKKLGAITWGFHGTTPESIRAIAKEGFKLPDELKKKKGKNKVELLDDGYFGNGIYFSVYSDYAMWYSEERESNEILLSALLQGESFQCTERMDGQGLKPGYDSQISPKGNEIIVFNQSQILPRYIIKFEANEDKERSQED